jgi:hypothetical protein
MMRRKTRRWLVSLLAAAFMFLQFATAAYACAVPVVAVETAAAMEEMSDCTGMTEPLDAGQPWLCKSHCQQGNQTVNTAAPLASWDLGAGLVVDWLLMRLVQWGLVTEDHTLLAEMVISTAPPDGAIPVYLALQVLRI